MRLYAVVISSNACCVTTQHSMPSRRVGSIIDSNTIFFTFFHTECVARTTYADKLMMSLLTLVSLGVLAAGYGAVYTYIYGGTTMRSSSVHLM